VNIVIEYIKYRWNAKKRHGIHSPFVYEFSDRCLAVDLPQEMKEERSSILRDIKRSKETVTITDLGAGSLRMKKSRSVKNILKYSSSKGKWGELLYKICSYYQPQNILEFGTSLGIGTWHLHKGNTDGQLISIEGCPETYAAMKKWTGPCLNSNVTLICSSFSTYLERIEPIKFDLIFIDGHHDGNALLRYMEELTAYSHEETLFILDDIRWSSSMYEAWLKLQNDNNFHVSIDLFRMGILVKRPSQEKEHFILKI
jgi:predicted O-methyltransferase YrrM